MSERALITGATGFVGGLLLARLVADGRPVRALVRHLGDRERLPDPRVELAMGHLGDEESLVRAADGCDVVYHVAGMNQLCLADPSPLYEVNVDGTRRMLDAARRAGVRRVVHTSSAATLGGDGTTFLDETAGPPPEFTSHYARSKFEGEQIALGYDAVEVVVVNPSSVQGPGRTTGTASVFIGYLNGRLPFDLPARFGLCYTVDCVNGHLLAERKGRPGQRYVLNTDTLTNSEAIDLIAVISGLADRPRTLPLPVAMGVASVAETVARVRGRQPKLCRESVRTLGHPHLYDGSKATRELGLRYTPIRQALEATVRWYMDKGLVARPLPKFAGDAGRAQAEPAGSLFEPPSSGREREPSS
ncbi:MAG: NAD-dependent epimerase/dehydratase family protein [Actinomycetia bacterium]|jgi:dihydroflavonol-4-reductase|nr:NAD-dependent epimerase/dehydratase family protein [Actinomycetes bacterium]